MSRTVVIGAGQAGRRTAELLRGLDAAREIVLVGEEEEIPYYRPPLSKDVLLGDDRPRGLVQRDTDAFASQRIRLRTGTRVGRINLSDACVEVASGERIAYDSLVIATGARARALSLPASDARVLTLRTLADARALRARLRPGLRMAVLGAGLIGLEVAAAAIERECAVTVLEAADRVMARCVPASVGARIERWHRDAGVDLRLANCVQAVKSESDCLRLQTTNGEFEVDILLVAIGGIPNDELARDAGIEVSQGMLVDECGRSSAPNVFAAGEVARIRKFGAICERFETWQFAQYQPVAVAHALCGSSKPYAELPWHWTDHYKHNIQILGAHSDALEWLEREEEGRHSALGIDSDGRVKGAILINNGREVTPLRRLIAANRPIAREHLLDASVPFKQLSAAT